MRGGRLDFNFNTGQNLICPCQARIAMILVAVLAGTLALSVLASPAVAQTITLAVAPSNATVNCGATQQFTATVQGTSSTGVKWSASAGSITSSGLFTAPSVKSATSVTITATSVADGSKSVLATITVVNQGIAGDSSSQQQQTPTMQIQQQQGQYDGPAELPRVYVQ